ncbi:MAG TPA: class I SAM-dependent methyltransferase [Solirubrobacteraceae bacterium]|jgi:hypothetical protein
MVYGRRARTAIDLDALARYFGTDKSLEYNGYTPFYERHLGLRRTSVRRVLEIGVGGATSRTGYETSLGGQSLLMWQAYFPFAEIVGVDIHEKQIVGDRIRFERGDQGDPEFLAELAQKYGGFDVIIDDGSHVASDVITSFSTLWDSVRKGGVYVIEDLVVAYRDEWGGSFPSRKGTTVSLIKDQIDSTLLGRPDGVVPTLEAMHVYGGIAFFVRA